MVYTCKPKKISIYINSAKKTAAEIKTEMGCTALINGGVFDMLMFKPYCHLKVNGDIYAVDQYKYWGYAWDSKKLILTESYATYQNYISCVCMVRNGKVERMYYNSDMGGSRQRTAIGLFADGRIWLYCDKTNKTPEELQQIALAAGLESAIMLDGGGSTQGIFPNGAVTASRIVHNYICVWAEESTGEDTTKGKNMTEPLICLDAGHGKYTAGKRCLKSIDPNETHEWILNDRIARYTAEGLAKYACQTMRVDDTTGETDVSLYDRVKKANDANADIFLSFHHNAGINGGDGGGICVFRCKNASATSVSLQDAIYDSTVAKTGLRGNRATPKPISNFYVIYHTDMPAILGEFGFMDSTADTPIILTDDFARKCANGIVEGIVKVMKLKLNDAGIGKNTMTEQPADYAANACNKAISRGIFSGDSNGNYNWVEPVTRQDFCVLLDRLGLLN